MNKAELTNLLSHNDKVVERAVVVLWLRQTEEEQSTKQTSEHNSRGFNGIDAEILSSFAEHIMGRGSYEYMGREYQRTTPKHLSPKQLELARRKLPKYWAQLAEEAAAKAARQAPEVQLTTSVVVESTGELFDDEPVDAPQVASTLPAAMYHDLKENVEVYQKAQRTHVESPESEALWDALTPAEQGRRHGDAMVRAMRSPAAKLRIARQAGVSNG